jgi:hypothetical protein
MLVWDENSIKDFLETQKNTGFAPISDWIEQHNRLKWHSRGDYPAEIINADRPNEDERYKDYRKSNYTPISKSWWGKMVNICQKIPKTEDWSIKHNSEKLKDYAQNQIPFFKNIEDWFWDFVFPNQFESPNGVIVAFQGETKLDNEPYPVYFEFFNEKNVIGFEYKKSLIIHFDEKSLVEINKRNVKEGNIFMFIDSDNYILAKQVGKKSENRYDLKITKNIVGEFPAWQIGGILEKIHEGNPFYKSFFEPSVPYFNDGLARHSDHKVNMVLHLHPDRWEIQDSICNVCNGVGKVTIKDSLHTCKRCNGNGWTTNKTPFGVKLINPTVKLTPSDSTTVPTPPMGYANRPIESLDFLVEEINRCRKLGYSAMNFDFLDTEVNQSGVAKQVDRSESMATLYRIAKSCANNLIACYSWINKIRFQGKEELPDIVVPTYFDVVDKYAYLQRLGQANLSSGVKSELELDYLAVEFGEDSEIYLKAKIANEQDPLVGFTVQEKIDTIVSGAIDRKLGFLSVQINNLIEQSYEEILNLDFEGRRNVLLSKVVMTEPIPVA